MSPRSALPIHEWAVYTERQLTVLGRRNRFFCMNTHNTEINYIIDFFFEALVGAWSTGGDQ